MRKKLSFIISMVIVSAFGFFVFSFPTDIEKLQRTFELEAIYYDEQQTVTITFKDNSQKTNFVTLEILGLEESFQKTYYSSSFDEVLFFENTPVHGWKVHPVVLVVDHQELGRVELKTEIHSIYEPKKPIIYGSR